MCVFVCLSVCKFMCAGVCVFAFAFVCVRACVRCLNVCACCRGRQLISTQRALLTSPQAHTHYTHTRTRTRTRTRTHTNAHTHTQTDTHTYTHTRLSKLACGVTPELVTQRRAGCP